MCVIFQLELGSANIVFFERLEKYPKVNVVNQYYICKWRQLRYVLCCSTTRRRIRKHTKLKICFSVSVSPSKKIIGFCDIPYTDIKSFRGQGNISDNVCYNYLFLFHPFQAESYRICILLFLSIHVVPLSEWSRIM